MKGALENKALSVTQDVLRVYLLNMLKVVPNSFECRYVNIDLYNKEKEKLMRALKGFEADLERAEKIEITNCV